MNRLVLSSAMIMAFSTAVGASLILGDRITTPESQESMRLVSLPTPAHIAAWKASATTTDYIPPAPPR